MNFIKLVSILLYYFHILKIEKMANKSNKKSTKKLKEN